MGYVKNRIKELSKESGSINAAKKTAEKWFEDSVKSRKLTEAEYTRARFEPGKIYVFEYTPITENLPWFDKNPVVLAIEQVDGNDLGINLNLLPVEFKEQLLDDLYNRLERQINRASSGKRGLDAEGQKPLRITYDGMKAYLKRFGFDFAIRQYATTRKSQQVVVAYERWPEIALCDFLELNGSSVGKIRAAFRNHLNK
jgi:hypothetical protein